ncbi:MAG: hypothetical protein M1814_006563 [Vezdaea aestivalis]|nr:MAG: hypothetical protein M1814_006563 [Vezdaea aestivalis]
MFSPIDPGILARNPQFAKLYDQLTTSLLNGDGSTTRGARKDQVSVDNDFQKYQLQNLEFQWIRSSLLLLGDGAEEVDEELQEAIELAAVFLNSSLAKDDLDLLEDDLDQVQAKAPFISQLLSSHFETSLDHAQQLAIVKDPSSSEGDAQLPKALVEVQQSLVKDTNQLLGSRLALLATVQNILSIHADMLTAAMHHVETMKQTFNAELRARAQHLATVAEGMTLKLQIMSSDAMQAMYDEAAVSALRNYEQHLLDTKMRMEQRERAAIERLGLYEEGGKEMRGIAENYAALVKTMDSTKKDIHRLGGETGV